MYISNGRFNEHEIRKLTTRTTRQYRILDRFVLQRNLTYTVLDFFLRRKYTRVRARQRIGIIVFVQSANFHFTTNFRIIVRVWNNGLVLTATGEVEPNRYNLVRKRPINAYNAPRANDRGGRFRGYSRATSFGIERRIIRDRRVFVYEIIFGRTTPETRHDRRLVRRSRWIYWLGRPYVTNGSPNRWLCAKYGKPFAKWIAAVMSS